MSVETTINQAESIASEAAGIAAMSGNPIAAGVAAGLQVVDGVTQTVEQSQAAHASALQTAAAALQTAAASAPAASSALAPGDAATVTALAQATPGILADIEKVLSIFGIKL